MTTLIAAVDNSAAAQPVLAMASALAPLLGASVRAVHVSTTGGATAAAVAERMDIPLDIRTGDPLEELTTVLADDDVVGATLGARGRPIGGRPVGHLALAVADATDKPVVIVPPGHCAPPLVTTVLIAIEGTPAKGKSLRRIIKLATSAGLKLVAVHVDDECSIPSFTDQAAHETEAYATEFLDRFLQGAPDVRLELRFGDPVQEILGAAQELAPDMLAMGWPQSPDPTRGLVAREVVGRSGIPVLLVATV